MTGPGGGDKYRRLLRLSLVVFGALGTLVAAASAMAGGGGGTLGAPPGGVSLGLVHHATPIFPRVVHPHKAPPGRLLGHGAIVQGAVPPSLHGGKPTTGLPPIVSDGRLAGQVPLGAQLGVGTSGAFAPSGNFANLLALTGVTSSNSFNTEPPDTQMAAGPTQIVEAVNSAIRVFNRSGTQLAAYSLASIFQPVEKEEVGLADPKILFDPTTGDFYMTEMVCGAEPKSVSSCRGAWTHMGISLAVSSNPQNGWSVYDYVNDGQNLQDQDKLGFSGDKITFAVNAYNNVKEEKFIQENIVVIQKSDVVAGKAITPALYSDTEALKATSTYLFDSMPTTPVNASTSDNTQYVVWDFEQKENNFMKLIRITGTPNAKNVDFTGNVTKITIANQTAPPAPVQPGGTLGGDKQNFQSAMVQGNDLWAIATDGCTPQFPQADTAERDCTRLVEVDLGTNSATTDTDLGTDGTYRQRPSVMKDSAGHVFFGFTISSSTQNATAALDASALPLPAVLGRIDFASGDATYTGTRWGDYSGTQQDPADTNDVWSAQEFGACDTACKSVSGENWATALGQFTFRDPHITSISPTQGPVPGGSTVDIYGSEFAKGATTVKFGANASSSVTWLESTHIQAVSPAGSQGTVDVTAKTAAGTSDTSSADQFTYIKIPTTTTYTGPTSGDYNDSVTLSAKLTNNLNSQGVAEKTLSFTVGGESCSAETDANGNASCSVTLLDSPNSYTVSVGFSGDEAYDPSGASIPFTVNQEESKVSYTGATTSHYHDPVTVSAKLTDPIGGAAIAEKQIKFTLGIGDTCSATTDSSGNASCKLTPHQTGTQSIVASFAGDTNYVSSSDTKSFSITAEETTMAYTGPTLILAGASGATLTAKLVEDGSADNDGDGGSPGPVPAETVTLAIGTQTCTAATNSSGNVTCTIPSVSVPLGPEVVGAVFEGDAHYAASSDSKTAIVFAFPSRGAFALGDKTVATATPTTTVTWWADTWSELNGLSGGLAPHPFKGFVGTVTLPTTTPPTSCGSGWTTSAGNSPPPPSSVPSYMGTLVTSKVTKTGNTIAGNTVSIVVVKTDPGYSPEPVNHGTGRIVEKFC